RSLELKLGTIPEAVPAELEPALIPPPAKTEAAADADAKNPADKANDKIQRPKTGLISEKSTAHNQDYWAYVPNDYNAAYQYALVVWLHPPGDTFQAAALKGWMPQCEERGIILLAPKALLPIGWQPNEAEFVKDMTEEFQKKYSIDRKRIVLHGMGAGGNLAYLLASQEREIYRGVLTIQTPARIAPPDHEPDFRLQFFLVEQQKAPAAKAVKTTAESLRKLKFPVSYRSLGGDPGTYPTPADVTEFGRWVDLLDRI
ncbi:MAG: mucD 3, partial [Planctomycetaceae bacterium]|nr:mucD 3 [Planctomycetaceae bacterium]